MSEIYICRHDRLINFCAHCQAEMEGYSTTASTGEQTKPRRVVQIACSQMIMAVLCNDGTVWEWSPNDEWMPFPPIPQDEGEK